MRYTLAFVLLFGAITPPGALAQDSFRALAARLAEVRRRLDAGDHAAAAQLADSLYRAAPAYPNAVLYRGLAAARAGREPDALAMLRRLLAWDARYAARLYADSAFAPYRPAVADLDVPGRAARAAIPIARARVIGVVAERDLVPEGTAYDGATGIVLVGSMYRNKIVAIGPGGLVRDLVPAGASGLGSVAGIHVDAASGTLWAASNARFDVATGTTPSALFAFDVRSGRYRAHYRAPPGQRFLNDITTTPDGTVFVTDMQGDRVWRLRPRESRLAPFEAAGPLAAPNGIAAAPDGRHLFVSDLSGIRAVALDGGGWWRLAVPDSIDVSGIDGLAAAPGALVAHHWGGVASRIARYDLDRARRRITGRVLLEANTPDVATSTTGEVAGRDYVFIGNSQLDRMNAGTVDAATMQPVRIYRVALDPPAPGPVAVSLSGRDSVALLDPMTLERVATLAVGNDPHEIAAAPGGRLAYVANGNDSSISVIDAESRTVRATWRLPDGIRVHDVAVGEDGATVWAASGDRLVLSLDAASGRVRRRYPLERAGSWMLEPRGARIVVAHLEGGAVTLLDPATGAERLLPAADGEIDATLTPDGTAIWSVNFKNGLISVFEAATGKRVHADSSAREPGRVTITPDGATALVVSSGDSTVVAFDVRSRRRIGAASVAHGPKVLALSPDGRRAYVTHPARGLVSLVDVPSLTVMRTAELPGAPDGVAVIERRRPRSAGTTTR